MPRGIVFSGTPYEGVGRLSRLLRLLGDLPEGAAIPANSRIYAGALVEAVKRFQQRHGRFARMVLDVETINELNVPLLHERIEQIRLALGRFWLAAPGLPAAARSSSIFRSFRLYAFNATGQIAFTMQVDVGQDYNHRTPVLESKIEYLVFRPYWEVPLEFSETKSFPVSRDDPRLSVG